MGFCAARVPQKHEKVYINVHSRGGGGGGGVRGGVFPDNVI